MHLVILHTTRAWPTDGSSVHPHHHGSRFLPPLSGRWLPALELVGVRLVIDWVHIDLAEDCTHKADKTITQAQEPSSASKAEQSLCPLIINHKTRAKRHAFALQAASSILAASMATWHSAHLEWHRATDRRTATTHAVRGVLVHATGAYAGVIEV
jgi:hypothetical protein